MEVTYSGPTLSDRTTTIILIPRNAKDFSIVNDIRSDKLHFKKLGVDDTDPKNPEIHLELEG